MYLIPDKIIDIPFGLKIKQKIIPDNLKATKTVASYIKKGDAMKPCTPIGGDGKPRGVTIHNTPNIKVNAATTPAEQYARATYNGNMGGAVVHYYVYKDDIWQLLRDDEQGWHAGDKNTRRTSKSGKGLIGGNLDTISIESIADDPHSTDTTSKLAAYLLNKHKLTINDLYTHKYFSGKQCPLYILPFWSGFEAGVKSRLDTLTPTPAPLPSFPDVKGEWYAEAVNALKAKGVINGYPDGTFKPEDKCTRAEVAKMVYEVVKLLDKHK